MKRIIVDTGVWYACFDKTDENHHCHKKILHVLNSSEIIIPFPTLYETINTRFAKNTYGQMSGLDGFIRNPQKTYIIADDKYKTEALRLVFQKVAKGKGYSLVDMIIRLMIEDVSLGDISVMTFNVGDFYGIRNIEIINPIGL